MGGVLLFMTIVSYVTYQDNMRRRLPNKRKKSVVTQWEVEIYLPCFKKRLCPEMMVEVYGTTSGTYDGKHGETVGSVHTKDGQVAWKVKLKNEEKNFYAKNLKV